MVAFLIEISNYLKTLFLHNPPENNKFVILSQRAATSKFIIKLSEVDKPNSHQIEGISAHNARLDCDE